VIDLRRAPRPLFSAALENNLRRLGSPAKVYKHFLAAVRVRLAADAAWLWRGPEEVDGPVETVIAGKGSVDPALVRSFAAGERPRLSRRLLLAPVKAHGRLVAVVGAERRARDFVLGDGRVLNRLCSLLGEELAAREEDRLLRVLDRIKGKVVAELRPLDLQYQILDGLHELVHYDHSGALLDFDPAAGVFRVEAEKIVWTKARSAFVGHELAAGGELLAALRLAGGPRVVAGDGAAAGDPVRRLLDYHGGRGGPAVASLLAAPLFFEEELLGVLKLASRRADGFDRRDAEVVERFLPAAAVSLRNARVHRGLEDRALEAEIRAGLTVLARAVAHDVNNALGALLPVVQQMRTDAETGGLDPETVRRDLEVIGDNAELCRRIFSNMLRLGAEPPGRGPLDLGHTLAELEPLLTAQTRPRSIELELDLAADLPPATVSRNHFERIAWNLVTNAAEAVGEGSGRITVATRAGDGEVVFSVTDDGHGIPPELLDRVQEPFYTTKSGGTGLGLAVCRSLAWQSGGRLEIVSDPETGTRVEVRFPTAAPEGGER
jgi:signal transduction histidine kinase